MKEILYVQAGTLPNFVGTHFWNTQESYFQYDDDVDGNEADELEINHDISFREGLSPKGDPTFCPRVLIFDRKANFGSLSSFGTVYAGDDEQTIVANSQWNGNVVEYKHEVVEKSRYHEQLEEELLFVSPDGTNPDPTQLDPFMVDELTVRYWSDYNRVDFHPRSIQKLPDLADWDLGMGDWVAGKETFDRYSNQDGHSPMDDSVRLFVEECDSLQGLQVSSEAATFGSFSNSFLSAFRDDFPKLPILHFQFLAEPDPQSIDLDLSARLRTALNDALCIVSAEELDTINVPILSQSSWGLGRNYDTFQSSALVSAHIESVTLPMRMKRGSENMSAVLNQLNWRNDTRFIQLSGLLPVVSPIPAQDEVINFSATAKVSDMDVTYSRRDVTRGFTPSQIASYEGWREGVTQPYGPLESKHALAYPLPTSFPRSIIPSQSIRPRQPKGIFSRSPSITALSTLAATTNTGSLLRGYATFVENFVKRKLNLESVGARVEMDDVRELHGRLWTIADGYGGDRID